MGIYTTVLLYLSSMLGVSVASVMYTVSNRRPGTTANITDILIGRCEEYRKCLLGEPCMRSFRQVKCEDAVESFLGAIRGVDPCYTETNAFDTFLDMVPPTTQRDTTMFWSGVAGANVHQDIAQVTKDFTVLGETFPGYMVGNLSWCGSTTDDNGLNFTVCPKWRSKTCPNHTQTAFWESASSRLARQAVGNVYVLLNAQREGGAFKNDSVFAQEEAPNLNPDKVTNIAIYLIPNFTLPIPNDSYRETCTNGTVLYLQNFLRNMNFNVTCEEDPTQVMWLQCARFPDSQYCGPYVGGTPMVTVSVAALLLQLVIAMSLSGWNTVSVTL